jgi:GAF domain-containing protein
MTSFTDPLRSAPLPGTDRPRAPHHGEIAGAPTRAEITAAMAAAEGIMAVNSLERALSGEASITDVGALAWLTLRTVAPCTSMAIFITDAQQDAVVARYAAGAHAVFIHEIQVARGGGNAGWTARTRRTRANGNPALDLGSAITTFDPPLLASLTVPLVYDGCLLGVLALYASTEAAFSSNHQRLIELLAPSLGVSVASVIEYQEPARVAPAQPKAPHLRLVRPE